MKTLRFAAYSFAASAALALCAASARADHDHHDFDTIDELASHVQAHSRSLALEVRRQLPGDRNYSHSHVVADVNALYRQSARIHSLIHAGVNPADLCRDVRKLDSLVHHLEETLSQVRPGHSHFDHWTHSHVWHGPDLRNIRRLTKMIEDDTHELMEEVETLESLISARPSGIYFSRPGISFRFGR